MPITDPEKPDQNADSSEMKQRELDVNFVEEPDMNEDEIAAAIAAIEKTA